jgi:hypothetical protein
LVKETDKSNELAGTSVPEILLGRPSTDEKDLVHELLVQVKEQREENHRLRELLERREKWIENREKQWEDREKQWEDREKQWDGERDETNKKIDDLREQLQSIGLQLKKEMGIERKSEKGSSLDQPGLASSGGSGGSGDDNNNGSGEALPSPEQLSSHEQRYSTAIGRPRPLEPEGLAESDSFQDWLQLIGSECNLIPATTNIFGSPVFSMIESEKDICFTFAERQKLFGRSKGLHSKKETSTVYDFDIQVQKMTCHRETLSDFDSGLRYSKEKSISPRGFQISWTALAKISTLVAEYAFPMERLSSAIGVSYFSSGNISRWFTISAETMIYPYIAMGKKLGKLDYLKTDDTSALVLEMRKAAKFDLTPDKEMTGEEWDSYIQQRNADHIEKKRRTADLVTPVIDAFGRVAQRADKEGAKTSVNVTVVSGRLDRNDHLTTVYFFRTHFGQAGNLLSRLLEYRSKEDSRPLVIQGDLSSQNHLEADIAELVDVKYIGCASHGRRPFFRYRLLDKQLNFFLLRCFAILASVESLIKRGPMTSKRILYLRSRHSAKVWGLMKRTCQAIVDEKKDPLADNQKWKKGDKLFTASAYVVNHFEELTYYLSHPEIDLDNNSSEAGLRGEKLIESASHFRQTENGRVALDIHRTMIASCNSCGLPYEQYLRIISEVDQKDIKAYPERYFPHMIAQTIAIRDPPPDGRDLSSLQDRTIH